MKKPIKDPQILFIDCETSPLNFRGWRLGKTVLRHGNLMPGYFSRYHIMSIQYRWLHEKKTKVLTWGTSLEDEKNMIKTFDKIANSADIVIGKNNRRFDDKQINTQKMWFQLEGNTSWMDASDDLESQIRKYFYLPSYALDYVSSELGLGGKIKMEFQDWIDLADKRVVDLTKAKTKDAERILEMLLGRNIDEIIKAGQKAEQKMFHKYGAKDVDDSIDIWNYCFKHFKPKFNYATYRKDHVCARCGSDNIIKNGTDQRGLTAYQKFHCKDCRAEAGRAPILKNGNFGKIR